MSIQHTTDPHGWHHIGDEKGGLLLPPGVSAEDVATFKRLMGEGEPEQPQLDWYTTDPTASPFVTLEPRADAPLLTPATP
jgi:hypothetical protein